MIDVDELGRLLPDYLPRQRWYGASDLELESVEVVDSVIIEAVPAVIDAPPAARGGNGAAADPFPLLVWLLVEARFVDAAPALFQVPVGIRPLDQTERFLEGKGRGFLGDLDTDEGPVLVYDALVDPDLALRLLATVAPDEQVTRVRAMNVEQSNTSVVYDERLILKLFRRVADGPNPDVEVTDGLARVGFEHSAGSVGSWQRDGRDLAVVRRFLDGGAEGWQLALTSLRDLYDSRLDPAESGGDFAPEARRLGEITAQMHVALGAAFGVGDGDADGWATAMVGQLGRSRAGALDAAALGAAFDRLRGVADPGCSIRVHGDLHLGQVLRTDEGWFVLDFEGEPALALDERRATSSALRDVAGMLRSFHYASQVALAERVHDSADDELRSLAERWEQRVGDAFVAGYLATEGIEAVLPADDADRATVLDAFVLHKAVYEVGYELAHRPDWVRIPLEAIATVLARG